MTAAHLDHEALADFAEGILDDATATSAEEHLAGCAECRERAAEVAEVSRVLADAPIPPMPAHLVDRLDAAIAAEAAAQMPVHRHARRFQLLAAAAAAVVVAGGGVFAVRTLIADGDSKSLTSSQPPVEEPSRAGAGQKPMADPSVPYNLTHSGTNYTATQLASQLRASLSKAGSTPSRAVDAAGSVGGCVGRVAGSQVPLLVDAASYNGKPATVIALPGSDARHADVWIVGPRCSASSADLIVRQQVVR